MKYAESGSGYSHSVGYTYDDLNNLTKLVETINGTAHTTSYAYDDDNRITSVTNGSSKKTYTYDGFGRISSRVSKHGSTTVLTDTITYRSPSSGKTSGQVATLKNAASGYNTTYTYTYDANGNIKTVNDGSYTTTYTYDSQNQLTREDNQQAGKSWTWTYDDAGNIQSKKEYAYTTGTLGSATSTKSYSYGNSNWGDLLTAYNGSTVSSDAIGNILSDGTWTYTWEHGRELATMSSGGTTWTFTYDANGMRTVRTNGSTAYSYVYNGSQLSQMTVGSNTLYFAYDASGTPLSVTYNGTAYYYAANLQGDITAILNTSGTAVVTYTYDAWGNILTTSGSMASTLGVHNPLRYRGYVYDTETGLYYLQSRYYNPQVGRFLNADAFAATGQGLLGNNMFAYCNNNPVIYHDSTGNAPISYHNGDRNPLFIGHVGLGGGGCGGIITGGVGTSRKTAKQQANDILQREVNYLSNTDEQVVLDADYIAFYNGVLVVKCDNSLGSFSFGFILLQNTANKAKQKKSLLHEYGHYEHLRDIGIMNYASKVVVPSVTCATLSHLGLLPAYYYDLPWEYIADQYGMVNRDGYSSWAGPTGFLYWLYSLV